MAITLNGTTGITTPAISSTGASTFTGALALPSGGLTVGTDQLAVDASGRVTMPYQPAFLAGNATLGDTTVTANTYVPFDTTSLNVGGHFNTSTYVFTAPVAGIYQFQLLAFFTSSGGNTQNMQLAPLKNGSLVTVGGDVVLFAMNNPNTTSIICFGGSVVLNLNAGDYVGVMARSNNARLYMGHTKFSGYLLG